MNLLERNNEPKDETEKSWRDDIREEKWNDAGEAREENEQNSEEEAEYSEKEENKREKVCWNRPSVTALLLGVIVVLLICILVLLFSGTERRQKAEESAASQLQQNISDYAQQQKQEGEQYTGEKKAPIIIERKEDMEIEEREQEKQEEAASPESADKDKTAIVVDVEDENDVCYSKEYILNEALPYFRDNNQEAIWDLTHLKRYVKLSEGLKGTDSYYYTGEVNADGKPQGEGLAIYEDNSYYYGHWENGLRCGDGRWFHFYIRVKDKTNKMGIYMAHSYSGGWKDDLPDGYGSEHYDVDISKLEMRERILQNVVGNFSSGLYDGELFANTVDYTGNEEEWYGTAEKGVFELFRDVSAIGECSVWQKKDDQNLYMDIDESENKNQGIEELLK